MTAARDWTARVPEHERSYARPVSQARGECTVIVLISLAHLGEMVKVYDSAVLLVNSRSTPCVRTVLVCSGQRGVGSTAFSTSDCVAMKPAALPLQLTWSLPQ